MELVGLQNEALVANERVDRMRSQVCGGLCRVCWGNCLFFHAMISAQRFEPETVAASGAGAVVEGGALDVTRMLLIIFGTGASAGGRNEGTRKWH